MGLNERAESRFVWNKVLLQPFQSQNLKSYCLPLIHGCKLARCVVNIVELFWIYFLHMQSCQSVNYRLTINNLH